MKWEERKDVTSISIHDVNGMNVDVRKVKSQWIDLILRLGIYTWRKGIYALSSNKIMSIQL